MDPARGAQAVTQNLLKLRTEDSSVETLECRDEPWSFQDV